MNCPIIFIDPLIQSNIPDQSRESNFYRGTMRKLYYYFISDVFQTIKCLINIVQVLFMRSRGTEVRKRFVNFL